MPAAAQRAFATNLKNYIYPKIILGTILPNNFGDQLIEQNQLIEDSKTISEGEPCLALPTQVT